MKKLLIILALLPSLTFSQHVSKNTGIWMDGLTWLSGLPPPLTGGSKLSVDVTIAKPTTVTLNNGLEVQSGTILIIEGVLIVTGDILFKNGSVILVTETGTLHIQSSGANANNSTDVTINGQLIIDNDFEAGSGSTILGIGTVTITGASSGAGTIFGQATGCSNCSYSDGGLPIELLSFDANVDNNLVYLKWVVASQLNNDYFTIYKSYDAFEWEEVAIIPGNGTLNAIAEFGWIDNSPSVGISYYKLRQTDYDGEWEEFSLISIPIDSIKQNSIIRRVNILGKEVDDGYKGIIIDVYENGNTQKNFKLLQR